MPSQSFSGPGFNTAGLTVSCLVYFLGASALTTGFLEAGTGGFLPLATGWGLDVFLSGTWTLSFCF